MEACRGPRPGNMRQWQLYPMGLPARIGSIPVTELVLNVIGKLSAAWRKSRLKRRWVGPIRIVRRQLRVDRRRLIDFGNLSDGRRSPVIRGIMTEQAQGASDACDKGQGRKEHKERKERGRQGK
jgi:hypothetical protein